MKRYLLIILIFLIAVILVLFVGFYFSIFNSELSIKNSDWGDFGDYIAGTIGICFTLFSIILIYRTFFEQRKQQFETTFQQYVSNYYSLLNLINENWLHNPKPDYRKGREIFGNAISYIKTGDEKNTFIKIFGIHNNVFQHYCGHIIELLKIIENNNELKRKTKEIYVNRFLSMLSTYEFIFIAYYIDYLYSYKNRNEIIRYLKVRLNDLINTESMPYISQIRFIVNKYK